MTKEEARELKLIEHRKLIFDCIRLQCGLKHCSICGQWHWSNHNCTMGK